MARIKRFRFPQSLHADADTTIISRRESRRLSRNLEEARAQLSTLESELGFDPFWDDETFYAVEAKLEPLRKRVRSACHRITRRRMRLCGVAA